MAEGKTIRTRRKAPETESIRLVINGQTYDLNIGSRVGEVEVFHTLAQLPTSHSEGRSLGG